MKNRERTFFGITKKFLSPILCKTTVSIRAVITYFIWSIVPVIHVAFIQIA